MFEHLDDPRPPMVTADGADGVWRTARRRTLQSFAAGFACVALAAGTGVALERHVLEQNHVNVNAPKGGNGGGNNASPAPTSRSHAHRTTTSTVARPHITPGGTTGQPTIGTTPSGGTLPTSPNVTTPGDPFATTPTTTHTNTPPAATDLVVAVNPTSLSGSENDTVSVTITISNPTAESKAFYEEACSDPGIRRVKLDGWTMTPDYKNCGLTFDGGSNITLAPGKSWSLTQAIKLHNAAGGLAAGHYTLILNIAGGIEIPVTIS